MSFNDDIAERFEAEVSLAVNKVIKAILEIIRDSADEILLLEPYDAQRLDLLVGFQEGGRNQLARAFQSVSQRHQAISPKVSVSIKPLAENSTRIETKIIDYSYMQSVFSTELIGRVPHKRFLTDLGVALKRLDPTIQLLIGG